MYEDSVQPVLRLHLGTASFDKGGEYIQKPDGSRQMATSRVLVWGAPGDVLSVSRERDSARVPPLRDRHGSNVRAGACVPPRIPRGTSLRNGLDYRRSERFPTGMRRLDDECVHIRGLPEESVLDALARHRIRL